MILLLALTVRAYKARWAIYSSILIMIHSLLITDSIGYTKYDLTISFPVVKYFPLFVIGCIISDMESVQPYRPLDYLRNVNMVVAIFRNIVLIFFFMAWGSY